MNDNLHGGISSPTSDRAIYFDDAIKELEAENKQLKEKLDKIKELEQTYDCDEYGDYHTKLREILQLTLDGESK